DRRIDSWGRAITSGGRQHVQSAARSGECRVGAQRDRPARHRHSLNQLVDTALERVYLGFQPKGCNREAPMAADTLSRIFSALADPTRRDMVDRLSTADATVNQLAARYEMSLQAVYKHLRVLEDAG